MKKPAFSLIELLVVIGIVAVLAAVVLPMASASKEKARATDDADKLRKLGLGLMQYLHDHDELMFTVQQPPTKSWPETLQEKYVPDWHSFQSPFDLRAGAGAEPAPVSYGINVKAFIPAPGGVSQNSAGGNARDFAAPGELILLSPAADSTPEIKFSGVSAMNVQIQPPPATPKLGTHGMRNLINVLYADGHGAPISWKDYADSSSRPAGVRRWIPSGN